MNITELRAATILNDWLWQKMELQEIEDYVRQDLAKKLVDAIIDEDLIKIHKDRDLSTNTITMRTQLKIIQE